MSPCWRMRTMFSSKARVAGVLLLGCCLLATVPGCSFRRPGHGFVLGSRIAWRSADATQGHDDASCDTGCAKCSESDKPELLPWRSRLKGHRLGARLFHGRDVAGDPSLPEAAVPDDADGVPRTSVTPTAVSEDDIRPPESINPRPEPPRPDLVVD